ncbi:lipase [Corallincola holothuriorum]|uniref:Lipase n=1 Tax=Corallincola holothuriorum TaxID=2282215 RepID=A0A368NIT2_9GAMM|nr:VolA/Pla-1 family phospholipase [Corallincola holothuriorum]RCU50497.1 lipase [Corallincola holothuriorum]
MRKLIITLAVASALAVTGCDDESLDDARNDAAGTPVINASKISYDPANGVLPVPNDLLYTDTTDGTLNIPVTDPSDLSNPQVAINALDGWSTNQPFVINVITDGDVTLDPASAAAPGVVRIYETVFGGPLAPPECAEVPTGAACMVIAELAFGTDFITSSSGNQLLIMPLAPLKAKTGYLITTTSLLMDSESRPVQASSTYTLVKQDINTLPLGTPSQLLLQGAVNSYENAIAAFGVDTSVITYSGAMTTQSIEDVSALNRLTMAADPATTPVLMPPAMTGLTVADALYELGIRDTNTLAVASTALLANSTLTNVPYYLEFPNFGNCDLTELATTSQCDAINSHWLAAGDSPVTILGAVQSGALPPEAVLASCPDADLSNAASLVGCEIKDAEGNPIGLDPERNLTKYNPLAAPTEMQTLDVLVTLPDTSDAANGVRAALGLPAITAAPAAGWPVVVFSHGIGGAKEQNLALAGSFALQGLAMVSIDAPLHGSRGWDADMNGVFEISASSGMIAFDPVKYANANVLLYVKLDNLLTTRDNFRQNINDHLALRMGFNSLAQVAPGVFDPTRVSISGVSLGGINTVSTAAVGGLPLIDPTTGSELPSYYAFSTVMPNVPAQGLAGVFAYSETFGPVAKAAFVESDSFKQVLSDATGLSLEELAALEASDPDAYQALVDQVYPTFIAQFVFAAQTVVDSSDPVGYAPILAGQGVPVYLAEVVGDTVLPNDNSAFGLPLSGTEPLIRVLGLPGVDATVTGAPATGAVRFIDSAHGSVADPTVNPAATVEMQTQLAVYAASGGAMILVSDPSVVQPVM